MIKKNRYLQGEELAKYTVWVGGTEVTEHFVPYSHAKRILTKYSNLGYIDVVIQSRR